VSLLAISSKLPGPYDARDDRDYVGWSARFGISRDELRRRLAARGVETRTFFVPLHLQPI